MLHHFLVLSGTKEACSCKTLIGADFSSGIDGLLKMGNFLLYFLNAKMSYLHLFSEFC